MKVGPMRIHESTECLAVAATSRFEHSSSVRVKPVERMATAAQTTPRTPEVDPSAMSS
jgi:hypothetical protein